MSDPLSSEALFSRMITMIKDTNILEMIDSQIMLVAINEKFITNANIAIYTGYYEARDQAHSKKEINPRLDQRV